MNPPNLSKLKEIVRLAQAQGYTLTHKAWGVSVGVASDGVKRWMKTEGNNEIHPIGFVVMNRPATNTLLRTFAALMDVDLTWTVAFMDGFDHNAYVDSFPRDAYDLGVQVREYADLTS